MSHARAAHEIGRALLGVALGLSVAGGVGVAAAKPPRAKTKPAATAAPATPAMPAVSGLAKGAGKGLEIALVDQSVHGIDIESVTMLRSQLGRALVELGAEVVPYAKAIERLPDGLPTGCEARADCLRSIAGKLGANRLVLISTRSEGLELVCELTLVEGTTGETMGLLRSRLVGSRTDWVGPLADAALAITRPPPGKIEVRAMVDGAAVYVNGTLVGLTPLGAAVEAPAGRAKVLVEREGYARLELEIAVKIGEVAHADALLVPNESHAASARAVTGRWWFWAALGGAAVVLAGAGTLGSFLWLDGRSGGFELGGAGAGGANVELGAFGPGGAR